MLTILFYNFDTTKQANGLAEAERICREVCFEAVILQGNTIIATFNSVTGAFVLREEANG